MAKEKKWKKERKRKLKKKRKEINIEKRKEKKKRKRNGETVQKMQIHALKVRLILKNLAPQLKIKPMK